MELDEQSFLEEILALRRDPFDSPSDLFSCFDDSHLPPLPIALPPPPPFPLPPYCPFSAPFPADEPIPLVAPPLFTSCKPEPQHQGGPTSSSSCKPTTSRLRKAEGQPSKNLMAERRRRKRLNDRLSMLRSVVPKISKMDRTSILGDTIDYMKELLERIKGLQGEMEISGEGKHSHLQGIFKGVNPSEVLVRNIPQFEVERRELDTRIEICCASKPGLLLSTVSTLEALGLEIQQCVVSCFNDFGMQASCSEVLEQREEISVEEIKQALFRNAGYGGRCI